MLCSYSDCRPASGGSDPHPWPPIRPLITLLAALSVSIYGPGWGDLEAVGGCVGAGVPPSHKSAAQAGPARLAGRTCLRLESPSIDEQDSWSPGDEASGSGWRDKNRAREVTRSSLPTLGVALKIRGPGALEISSSGFRDRSLGRTQAQRSQEPHQE